MKSFFILLILAYILGSINTSIILFKIFKKGDPRQKFSQNPGVTNIYRQAGIKWAIFILIIDMVKALLLSILSLYFIEPIYIPWIGLFLILGNRYPCFHGFSGGKGVAALLGFIIPVTPIFVFISIIVWVIIYKLYKISFIASFGMVLLLSIGIISTLNYNFTAIVGVFFIFILIVYNHKKNISDYIKLKF